MLEVLDERLHLVISGPRALGAAAAALVEVDHAQLPLEERPLELREAVAVVTRTAVEEEHWWRARGAGAGHAIPEAYAIHDDLVLTRRERRGRAHLGGEWTGTRQVRRRKKHGYYKERISGRHGEEDHCELDRRRYRDDRVAPYT